MNVCAVVRSRPRWHLQFASQSSAFVHLESNAFFLMCLFERGSQVNNNQRSSTITACRSECKSGIEPIHQSAELLRALWVDL